MEGKYLRKVNFTAVSGFHQIQLVRGPSEQGLATEEKEWHV